MKTCNHPGCTKQAVAGAKCGEHTEKRSLEETLQQIPDEPAVTMTAPPTEEKPRPGRKAPASQSSQPLPDAEVVGGAIAHLLAHEEAQQRLETALRRSRGYREDEFGMTVDDRPRKAEKPRPWKVIPRRSRPDPTTIIDPVTGKPPESLKPGWVTRHVRTIDHSDRPTQARVAEFTDYGYEPILDKNGEAIVTRFGMAMQGPPEQYALRVTEKAPLGALNRDESLEVAMQWAEEANRAADQSVARVIVSDEHRTQRMQFSPGVEIIQD